MKLFATLSLAAATALFIGCGGGGGSAAPAGGTSGSSSSTSQKIKGYLVDSPVQGVLYACYQANSTTSHKAGLTNSEGAFFCWNDDVTVSFSIGKLFLGSVNIPTPDGNVYPQDLVGVGHDDFSDPKVVAMARFLQSIDDDSDPANGIVITQTMKDKFSNGISFSELNIGQLAAMSGVTMIDPTSAIEHLKTSMQVGESSSSSMQPSSEQTSSSSSTEDEMPAGSCTVEGIPATTDITAKGDIQVSCGENDFTVTFTDGSQRKAFQSIHIEEHDDGVAFVSRTEYDYTPQAFTITYYDGHDMFGNIAQASCVRTYAPVPLDDLDTADIAMFVQTPTIGNLGEPVSNTCSDEILYFGSRKSKPDTVADKQLHFVFTATDDSVGKIDTRVVTVYGQ